MEIYCRMNLKLFIISNKKNGEGYRFWTYTEINVFLIYVHNI